MRKKNRKTFKTASRLYVGSGVRAREIKEDGSRKIICDNCGHKWIPRLEWPNNCPSCGSPIDWDVKPNMPTNIEPDPEPEPIPETPIEEIPEIQPTNIDPIIPDYDELLEDELNDYDPDQKIPPIGNYPPLNEPINQIQKPQYDPLSSTQPENINPIQHPSNLRYDPTPFKTREQLIQEQRARQQAALEPIEDEDPGIDLSQIFGMVTPLIAGSFFRDSDNQSKASAVLTEFLTKNGNNLSKRLIGSMGSAVGSGGGYDPMLIELAMALISMVMLKMNENKKEKDLEDQEQQLEAIEDQLNQLQNQNTENIKQPLVRPKPIEKTEKTQTNVPIPETQSRALFKVRPVDEDLEKEKQMQNTEVQTPVKPDIGGQKMENELLNQLEITNEEIKEVTGIFDNIPPFIAEPLIKNGDDIFAQPAYKELIITMIQKEDPEKLAKIKRVLSLDYEDIYNLVTGVLEKENPKFYNLVNTKEGKTFLRKNLTSLNKAIQETGL